MEAQNVSIPVTLPAHILHLAEQSTIIKTEKVLTFKTKDDEDQPIYSEVSTEVTLYIEKEIYEFHANNLHKYQAIYNFDKLTIDEWLTIQVKKFIQSYLADLFS